MTRRSEATLISRNLDVKLWLLSAIIYISSLLMLRHRWTGRWIKHIGSLISCLIVELTIIEASSSLIWILASTPMHINLYDRLLNLEMDLFNSPQPVTPLILFLFVWAWIAKPIAKQYLNSIRNLLSLSKRLKLLMKSISDSIISRRLSSQGQRKNWNGTANLLMLSSAIAAGVFLSYYVYLPWINVRGVLIGVDSPHYAAKLSNMTSTTTYQAVEIAVRDGRTMIYLIAYLFYFILGDVNSAIKMVPVILSVLIGLSAYILFRWGLMDQDKSGLAALIAVLSSQLTVGMHAAIYANWLNLSWILLFLTGFFRITVSPSIRFILLTSAASVLMVYTHPWSWFFMMAVLVVDLSIVILKCLLQPGRFKTNLKMHKNVLLSLIFILTLNFIVDRSKTLLLGGPGAEAGYSIAEEGNIIYTSSFWFNFIITSRFYTGGFVSNFPFFLLGLIGMLILIGIDDEPNRLITSWSIVLSVALIYLEPRLQWRVLFMAPTQILTVKGLDYVTEKLSSLWSSGYGDNLAKTFTLYFILLMFNYCIRSIANLVPI